MTKFKTGDGTLLKEVEEIEKSSCEGCYFIDSDRDIYCCGCCCNTIYVVDKNAKDDEMKDEMKTEDGKPLVPVKEIRKGWCKGCYFNTEDGVHCKRINDACRSGNIWVVDASDEVKVTVTVKEKEVITTQKVNHYHMDLTEKEYIFFMACIGNSSGHVMEKTFDMNEKEISDFFSMYSDRKVKYLPDF